MGKSCGRNMVREEDVMGVEIIPGQEMSSRLSRTNRFQLAAFGTDYKATTGLVETEFEACIYKK